MTTTTFSAKEAHLPSSGRAVILGAGIGNALEWYDFASFVLFSSYFSGQFFKAEDPTAALLSTLAIFAVGFLLRPIGGIYFGWLSDRHGRRHAMIASMSITALGCLIIGAAPVYATAGLAAPLILVAGRLAQGFGLGGEIGASFTFLVESSPPGKRGLWSSSMFISITVGSLLATIVGLLLNKILPAGAMENYGWRIPFLIGALLGVYALFLRSRLKETEAFEDELLQEQKGGSRQSIWQGMMENKRALFMVIGLTAGPTLCFNTWLSGAITYSIHFKGMETRTGLWALMTGCVIFILVQPFWGALSDRLGRKPNLLIGAAGSAIVVYPLLGLIQGEFWQLAVAISAGLVVLAAWTSIAPAVYAELFPTRIRATGVALPYSITVALLGGTAPYLQNWLANQGMMNVFTGYLVFLNLVTVLTVLLMPETRGRSLE